MDTIQAINCRHSVREYTGKKIEAETREKLQTILDEINRESGLNISIVYDMPEAFDSAMARYGKFTGVNDFIVLKGKNQDDFSEKCGYYGEKLVLEAQKLGLNTCWVAMTFNKKLVKKLIPAGEKFSMVISLGYGATQGHERKSKSFKDVIDIKGQIPEWFKAGVDAALKAPTAINQQRFKIFLNEGKVEIKVSGLGFYTKTDLGIVKYHFEEATGQKVG